MDNASKICLTHFDNIIYAVMDEDLKELQKRGILISIWKDNMKVIVACSGNLSESIENPQLFKIHITLGIFKIVKVPKILLLEPL